MTAVVPIGLVAVVFLGVVRGGHHHAGVAFHFAHGKRKLRGGAEAVEDVDLDAVGRHHVGGDVGEGWTVVATVIRDGDTQVLLVGVHLLDVVGEALGGHGHGVDIHAVGAGTHDAAQSAGAELEVAVEALGQFVRVVVEHVLHALSRFFIVLLCEPRFCSFDDFRIHGVMFCVCFLLMQGLTSPCQCSGLRRLVSAAAYVALSVQGLTSPAYWLSPLRGLASSSLHVIASAAKPSILIRQYTAPSSSSSRESQFLQIPLSCSNPARYMQVFWLWWGIVRW